MYGLQFTQNYAGTIGLSELRYWSFSAATAYAFDVQTKALAFGQRFQAMPETIITRWDRSALKDPSTYAHGAGYHSTCSRVRNGASKICSPSSVSSSSPQDAAALLMSSANSLSRPAIGSSLR